MLTACSPSEAAITNDVPSPSASVLEEATIEELSDAAACKVWLEVGLPLDNSDDAVYVAETQQSELATGSQNTRDFFQKLIDAVRTSDDYMAYVDAKQALNNSCLASVKIVEWKTE